MSTAAVRAPEPSLGARPSLGQRAAARRRLEVPLSVTVLRSGVSDTVPGRSVDVCAGGIGAILAAELPAGELVGVEFECPRAGVVLAKARVCYQERLRCGLQFLAIPAEQRAKIELWVAQWREQLAAPYQSLVAASSRPWRREINQPPLPEFLVGSVANPGQSENDLSPRVQQFLRRNVLVVLIASVIVAVGTGWWRWEAGWRELESRLPGREVVEAHTPVTVPPEVMQQRLIHQVDPLSPDGPGQARVTGVAVLDAVVGVDGSVVSLRPAGGPDTLTRAAMESVQWWKFEPYRLNGQAVEVRTKIAVVFR
jgi:hypothetical protein